MVTIPKEMISQTEKNSVIPRAERQVTVVMTSPNTLKIRKILEQHPNLIRNRLINAALSEYLDKLQND